MTFHKKYVAFRNKVQDLIQKGMVRYIRQEEKTMRLDNGPFSKNIEANMISISTRETKSLVIEMTIEHASKDLTMLLLKSTFMAPIAMCTDFVQ